MDIIRMPLNAENLGPCEKDFFTVIRRIIARHKLHDYKIYVAGGWVRDYLMCNRSHDIDMIVDDRIVSTFVRKLQKEEQYSYLELHPKPLKTITLSAGYCKNLTLYKLTYKTDYFQVDVRELKSPYALVEDYNTRDFTVNAMYLNLATMEIEMTRNSYEDFKAKTIRCILSPRLTFRDATRYMRLVRFAGHKNFVIDKALMKYIMKEDITGLKEKLNSISKKSMQREISIMFERAGTSKSLELFVALNLHNYFELIIEDDVNLVGWRKMVTCRFQSGIELIKLFERLFSLPIFKALINNQYEKSKRYVYRLIKALCFALSFYLDGDKENFAILVSNVEIEEIDIIKAQNEIDYLASKRNFDGNIKRIVQIAQSRAEEEPFYFSNLVYLVSFLKSKGKNNEYIVHTLKEQYFEPLKESFGFNCY